MTRAFDLPTNRAARLFVAAAVALLALAPAISHPPAARAVAATASDTFTRTVGTGWGDLDTGQSWYITNGNDAATDVDGSVGQMNHSVIGELKARVPEVSLKNVDIQAKFRAEVLADEAPTSVTEFMIYSRYEAEPYFRYYYRLVLSFVAGAASPVLRVDRQAITYTDSIASVGLPATANDPTAAWMVRFETVGTAIRGKAWPASDSEPTDWQLDFTDTQVTDANQFAIATFTNDVTPTMPIDVDDVTVTEVAGDVTGPNVSSLALDPNPSLGDTSVDVTATATDPSSDGPSPVTAAEWFDGADPGEGAGTSLAGTFGSSSAALSDTIDVTGWNAGTHVIGVRAQDSEGNWGPVARDALIIAPADTIFADGFSSGTSAWSSASGALTPVSTGEPDPTAALEVTMSGSSGGKVIYDSPSADTKYRGRFQFDPMGAMTPHGTETIFVAVGAGDIQFKVLYRKAKAGPRIRLAVNTATGWHQTKWRSITDNAVSTIEFRWSAGADVNLKLWVNGVQRASINHQDTAGGEVSRVRLGAMNTTTGATGTQWFDEFVSTRGSAIGL